MQMILDEWFKDIPQQFLGKKNIAVLIQAFARQMQELLQVFDDLNTKLDLEKAEGQNLDYVGTIVSLSRKEAGILAGIGVEEPVISDERYRQFLKYKVLRNTNNCTYDDIMQSIEILWRTDNIRYVEDPERPATILIRLQTMSVDVPVDPLVGKVMAIKPAGVALIYTINYTVIIDFRHTEQFFLRNMHLHTAVPFWRARYFDGSEVMDGSHLMDAARDYDLRLGIIYGMGGAATEEEFVLAGAAVRLEVPLEESVEIGTQVVSGVATSWQPLECHKATTMVGATASVREEFGNATVRTQRNVAYFDGSLLMDGSHLMDSIDREEEI